MVTVNGFVDPLASPLHPVNRYPVAGVALRTTVAPLLNVV